MELQKKFHGLSWGKLKVPWNSIELRSMEKVPWNSMELWIWTKLHGIPWNSMTLEVLLLKYHGIPWNYRYCSVRHGTWIPWNSMELGVRQYRWHEQFRGIPLEVCQFRWHEQFHAIPCNSMELWVRQFRWHGQSHGIPRNLCCAIFDDSSSSMELLGSSKLAHCRFHGIPWNSMELLVIIIGKL